MMAVALIFPAGIQAEDCGQWDAVAATDLVAADGFDPRPEFAWTHASGATTYTIEVAEDNGFATIAQTGTLDAATCTGDTCSWTPTADLGIGDFYWRVSGTGECLKDPDNPTTFDIPASDAGEVSVMGVTASLTSSAADPIRAGDNVPVDVSLANLGFEAVDVSFSVKYDTGKFDTPTKEDVVLGLTGFTADDITTFDTTTPGTVKVTIAGSDAKLIPENAGTLATLNFTVKDNPTLGAANPAFTVTIDDITAKVGDEDVEVPGTAAQSGTQAAVTVSPEAGDADGMNGITLKDAVIFLQVGAGQPTTTVYAGADVDGDGVVGVPEAISVMAELAK
jgi:hypothetical protein